MQQQPARDKELGPLWRSIYVPDIDAGKPLFASCDFSSQEPRLVVHYADILGLPAAGTMAEQYRNEGAVAFDLHRGMAELLGWVQPEDDPKDKAVDALRSRAKQIFLALCYGMGEAKLCRSLGYPTVLAERADWKTGQVKQVEVAGPEGKAVLERFHQMIPFVAELSQRASARAKRKGVIRTHGQRACHFPYVGDRYFDTQKALNRLIQGSAADQTKLSMIAVADAGFAMQLQVHDELDLSVRSCAEAETVMAIMRDATTLRVPTRIDIEVGESWGAAVGIAQYRAAHPEAL